jgi:RHS repeat-associated protein
MPTTDAVTATGTGRKVQEVRQSTIYTDGLNRPLQSVIKSASSSGKDIVSPKVYDAFGREPLAYLPYVQTDGNSNDGKFKSNPFNSQQTFMQNAVLNPSAKGESIFYNQMVFEQSPSSFPIKSYSAGNSYANEGGKKNTQQYNFVNTAADSVRVWEIAAGIPVTTKIYGAGQLSESVSISENGAQLVEYTDKLGRVILRKAQLAISPGAAHGGWLCTYFVYDELNNLRFVIPPLAVEKINPTWSVTNVLPGLCTIYRYDAKGRNIVTKLPGVDSTEMVYDTRDRLVLVRNGNLKGNNQWMVTYFDNLDRPVKVAMYSANTSREVLQTNLDGITPGTFPFIPAGNLSDLGMYFYDDNYAFPGVQSPLTGDFSVPQKGNNFYEMPNIGISHRVMGKMTGVRSKILNTSQWLTTTIYYNDKGKVLQTISDNIYGGKQTNTLLYDFSGKVLSSYLRHTNPHSTVTPETRVLTSTNYDSTGRVTEISTVLNDVASTRRIIASYSYDEMGNVKTKTIPKETQSIEYNINGQLKAINSSFVNTAGSSANWFGEDLAYDYGFSASQYNGSIAGVKWKSRGDGISRAFGYTYDNAGRVSKADFTQQNQGNTGWTTDKVDFSVKSLAYDGNGNISGMLQKGMKGLSIAVIDSLKYSYIPYSNKLFFVTDKNNDPQSKLGDFKEINNNETQDYAYDANGNLTLDMNRLLSPGHYNFLNLPDSLTVLGKGYIEYTYDAAGNKLRKKVTEVSGSSPGIKIYDYIDGFVYLNDSLIYFPHGEGRIRATYATGKPVALAYDYFITDHLGNTRMVLTEETNQASYAATMETASSAKENALFANIESTKSAKPVGYPADGTTSPNDFVSKLNAGAGTQKIGPSLVLRVMAGDTIQLGAKAFYKSAAASTSSTTASNMLTALLQAFAIGSAPSDGVHGNGTGAGSPLVTNFTAANYQAIRDKDPSQNQVSLPKAYLNYVLFDDLLNMVDENSGVRQVQGSPDQLQTLATSRMVIKKDGFFYVYTSNESIQDVYFDNIVVAHNNGPLLEETHYYPFGLTMAGISSRALKNPYAENRNNFNGIEQTTELGLNQYDAFYRTLDPQIGRWWQMDPAFDDYPEINPYNCNFNNPISFIDPEGNDPFYGLLWWLNTGIGYTLPEVTVAAPRIGQKLLENQIVRYITTGILQTAATSIARVKAIQGLYSVENARRNLSDISKWTSGKVDQSIQNVTHRIQTHTTTPELVANSFMENPLAAITGVAGTESIFGIATLEELGYGARGASKIPDGKFYSVAFEAEISDNFYPGYDNYAHFKEANKILDDAIKADPKFAKIMEELGVEVPKSSRGTIKGKPPTGFAWHHHIEPGKFHLVPKSQHPSTPGGIFWKIMHPNGKGGMSMWGK